MTSPWTIGLAVFVLALFTFVLPKPNVADPNVRRAARRTGFLHAILQLGLLLLVEGGIGLLFAHFDGRHQWGSWPAAFAVALSVSIGGLVATLLFGKYVTFVNQRYRVFDNIAFSGRHIRGYKQFLRFRMNVATGDLTIFVVGIDTIERGWASALATGGRPPAGRLTLVDVIEVPGSRRAAPVAVTPPTQVTAPQPTLVTAPEPTLVTAPAPTQVTVPEPTLVTAPEPTLVTAPAPILAEPVPVAMSQPTPVALPEGRGPNLGRFARSFEAVVIGTGFGGAVVACRLSQKWPGKVLVLERGKRYPAGSFARTPKEMANNFWNADGERKGPLRYRHHEQRGLFDIRSFKKMDAVMAAGYGGGSLIYANVILEPPDTVFNDERWPDTCAKEALRPYYDTVREVLHARPIPPPTTPDRRIPRTEIFEQAATKMGRRSRRLDLAVHFGNDDASPLPRGRSEANRYGADQTSCTYCGECDIGCNAHAKNSLDLNYLYVAEHCHQAVVETDSLVELIVPLDANGSDDAGGDGTHGYRVQYRDLNASYSTSVRTNRVIVSAGSLGSTELLLRCRDVHRTLPNLSLLLGRGFSGNGDFLSFITGSALDTEPIYGPVITQGIDFNLFEGYDPERAFIMEDAGYPNQMAWLVEGSKPRVFKIQAIGRTLKHTAQRWVTGRAKGRVGYRLHDLLRGDISGGSAVVLCMGIDTSTGTMRLGRNGWLNIDWPLQHNLALYNAIRKASKDFKKAIYANVVTTAPNWWLPFRRNVTVHALGGCNLGPTLNDGVVSSDPVDFGQVFGYRGLYVADGAIVPTAVGANPSLTIAALAEMVAHGITGQLPSADLGTGRARPSSTATP